MVLGSACCAARVPVSAPPAPTVTSMSIVCWLPSEELAKYGIVSAPAMSVPVMVLPVMVIEKVRSETVKPPNISTESGPAPRSMPRVPLNPAGPYRMLARSTLGPPSGTLTSTVRPFWLPTARTLPPSAVLTWPSSQPSADSIRLSGADTDIGGSRIPFRRRGEGGRDGLELLGDLIERVRGRAEAARVAQQVAEQRGELAGRGERRRGRRGAAGHEALRGLQHVLQRAQRRGDVADVDSRHARARQLSGDGLQCLDHVIGDRAGDRGIHAGDGGADRGSDQRLIGEQRQHLLGGGEPRLGRGG